jgi:predicted component of type VI protein secretion system
MTVSELVVVLARIVERSSLARSANQEKIIAGLAAMPEYLQRRRLDLWEHSIPSEDGSDNPVMGWLLDEIFEFGRCNLYTQFSPERSLQAYATVGAKLLEAGLSPPQVEEINEW